MVDVIFTVFNKLPDKELGKISILDRFVPPNVENFGEIVITNISDGFSLE